MATSYPTALDTTAPGSLPTNRTDTINSAGVHPSDHDNLAGAVIALETKLGTGATTPTSGQRLVGGASAGSTVWTSPILSKTIPLIQPSGTFPLIFSIWRVAPGQITITAIYGRREGGTAASINARRVTAAGAITSLLTSDFAIPLPTPNPWQNAGAIVASPTLASGDSLEAVFQSVAGSPSLVEIQIDYLEN